jgi:hypothetical protein
LREKRKLRFCFLIVAPKTGTTISAQPTKGGPAPKIFNLLLFEPKAQWATGRRQLYAEKIRE